MNKKLLFFIDYGGFDDFTPLFFNMGFDVDLENSQRKAVKLAKKNQYDVLVAEFSYNPEFRDRVSNIESLLAMFESYIYNAKIIILYDEVNYLQLEQLKRRYKIDVELVFPINEQSIKDAIAF